MRAPCRGHAAPLTDSLRRDDSAAEDPKVLPIASVGSGWQWAAANDPENKPRPERVVQALGLALKVVSWDAPQGVIHHNDFSIVPTPQLGPPGLSNIGKTRCALMARSRKMCCRPPVRFRKRSPVLAPGSRLYVGRSRGDREPKDAAHRRATRRPATAVFQSQRREKRVKLERRNRHCYQFLPST
jgi:hypothetical protein